MRVLYDVCVYDDANVVCSLFTFSNHRNYYMTGFFYIDIAMDRRSFDAGNDGVECKMTSIRRREREIVTIKGYVIDYSKCKSCIDSVKRDPQCGIPLVTVISEEDERYSIGSCSSEYLQIYDSMEKVLKVTCAILMMIMEDMQDLDWFSSINLLSDIFGEKTRTMSSLIANNVDFILTQIKLQFFVNNKIPAHVLNKNLLFLYLNYLNLNTQKESPVFRNCLIERDPIFLGKHFVCDLCSFKVQIDTDKPSFMKQMIIDHLGSHTVNSLKNSPQMMNMGTGSKHNLLRTLIKTVIRGERGRQIADVVVIEKKQRRLFSAICKRTFLSKFDLRILNIGNCFRLLLRKSMESMESLPYNCVSRVLHFYILSFIDSKGDKVKECKNRRLLPPQKTTYNTLPLPATIGCVCPQCLYLNVNNRICTNCNAYNLKQDPHNKKPEIYL